MAALGARAQNVGVGGTSPKDVTIVSSLQKLKEQHGTVDGPTSLNLAKEIFEGVIKDKVNPNAADPGGLAIGAARTAPTNEYTQARHNYDALRPDYTRLSREYEVLKTKVAGETAGEKAARKALRDAKKLSLIIRKLN